MKKRLGILAMLVLLSGLAHAEPIVSATLTIKTPPPAASVMSRDCGSRGC
jgi:hypothetical protein